MDLDYFSIREMKEMGFASLGKRVLICRSCKIYHPDWVSIGSDVIIDDFTILNGHISIGDHVHISSHCELYTGNNAKIVLMDFAGLSSHVSLYAETDDYFGPYMTNPAVPMKYRNLTEKDVVLEKHSLIGTHGIVLPGVTVAEGCTVGANSMLIKSTKPWGLYSGSPAKRIIDRSRKALEYEEEMKNAH